MLQIIGESSSRIVEIEFGDYVPFKFQCSYKGDSPHLYWRTGDLESTLLEIQIDRKSGEITSGSLLLVGNVSSAFPNLPCFDQMSSGIPVVSTNTWTDDRYIDDPSSFQVFVDSSRLLIQLSEVGSAVRSIVSGCMAFGVALNGSLSWILISGLAREQLVKLDF